MSEETEVLSQQSLLEMLLGGYAKGVHKEMPYLEILREAAWYFAGLSYWLPRSARSRCWKSHLLKELNVLETALQ